MALMRRNKILFLDAYTPLAGSMRYKSEVDDLINSKGLYLPTTYNRVIWCTDSKADRENNPRRYSRNQAVCSSMVAIGGGGIAQLRRALRCARVGGSTQDRINYVALYSCAALPSAFSFKVSKGHLRQVMLGKDRKDLLIASSVRCLNDIKVNYQASSGTIHSFLGLRTKEDSMSIDHMLFRTVYASWVTAGPSDRLRPSELWTSAARPKLLNLREKILGIRRHGPCSRTISYASPLESMVAWPLYLPIASLIKQRFSEHHDKIAIGCQRMNTDWVHMSEHFSGSKFVYVGDYSKYDQRVPNILMRRAFEVILSCFDSGDIYTSRYISSYKQWLEDNMFARVQDIDKQCVFGLSAGIPSGSIWTSVLGSVCNMIVVEEFALEFGLQEYNYFIYGDDHVIIVKDEVDPEYFKRSYEQFVEVRFDMILSGDSSYVSLPQHYYVKYKRPVYKPGNYLAKGTRDLKPIRYEYSDTPFVSYDHSKGTTHRWEYKFGKRIKFLQYYWTLDGLAIRPWPENLARLVNPEQDKASLEQTGLSYVSHLMDNFNNAHVRNWIYHLMYDLGHIKVLSPGGKMSPVADLHGEPHARRLFKEGLAPYEHQAGSRAWYRRSEEYSDLAASKCMQKFNREWVDLCAMIEKALLSCSQEDLFRKKDVMSIMLDKRRKNSEKAYLKTEEGAPFSGRQNFLTLACLAQLLLGPGLFSLEAAASFIRSTVRGPSSYLSTIRRIHAYTYNRHQRATASWEELESSLIRLFIELINKGLIPGEHF